RSSFGRHLFYYFDCQRAFSESVVPAQRYFRFGDWKYGLRFQNRHVTFYEVVNIACFYHILEKIHTQIHTQKMPVSLTLMSTWRGIIERILTCQDDIGNS